MGAKRIDWDAVMARAVEIVDSYDTAVTLRQLFYRLVAALLLANTRSTYVYLSRLTAEARRQGTFPRLADQGRVIHRYNTVTDANDAMQQMLDTVLLDRSIGQEVSLYLGVEKAGIVNQLMSWFGADLGIPVLALGGYSSQDYVDRVKHDTSITGRPAVLLYAGDFDPSGEDIDRDFVERTDCWAKVIRLALNVDQIRQYDLPPMMGKTTDSRAAGFIAKHGELIQVELDALPPDVLRGLYTDAIGQFWNDSAHQLVLAREAEVISHLERLRGLL